jgi:hypothetical protein
MNPPEKSFPELMSELESLGVTKNQIDAYLQEADAERTREAARVAAIPQEDPLDAISAKLDKLQESVDALAAKLS